MSDNKADRMAQDDVRVAAAANQQSLIQSGQDYQRTVADVMMEIPHVLQLLAEHEYPFRVPLAFRAESRRWPLFRPQTSPEPEIKAGWKLGSYIVTSSASADVWEDEVTMYLVSDGRIAEGGPEGDRPYTYVEAWPAREFLSRSHNPIRHDRYKTVADIAFAGLQWLNRRLQRPQP
jgi:hypothetical protein